MDSLVSSGYPLETVKNMTLNQAIIFFGISEKRKSLDLARVASNIRCAVWADGNNFEKYLQELIYGK